MEIIKGDARNCYAIQELLQGCQAVINAVGQLKKRVLHIQCLDKSYFKSNEYKIKRYILISGGSLDIKGDQKSILNKIGAVLFQLFFQKMMSNKYKELRLLQHSAIDWTVVRLPFVVEGTGIEQSKRM